MKKITAKYITENIDAMRCGQHIIYRGAEYWINGVANRDLILWISEDRKISGCINGHDYARVIDGVVYRCD